MLNIVSLSHRLDANSRDYLKEIELNNIEKRFLCFNHMQTGNCCFCIYVGLGNRIGADVAAPSPDW